MPSAWGGAAALLFAIAAATANAQVFPMLAQPATAEQQLKNMNLEQLGQIEVVTYSKTPTGLWDTPASLYVITSDDIQRSGATSIADALRLAPGVEVGRLSSTTWAIGIRGLQSNFSKSVLVLIDGRNVYTPLFAGVYWDVQDMPLEDIDHIEVIRGPGGTIWGPNAANGVINIITKSARETQGVTARALAGTEDHTIDSLQYGGTGRNVSYRVFGKGFEREHEYHTDGLNVDGWHQERVGFRADYATRRDELFAEGDAYRGTSPHIIGTSPVYDETSGGDVNVRWQRRFAGSDAMTVQGYFDRTLRTDPSSIGEARNTFDLEFTHNFKIGDRNGFSYGGALRWSPTLVLSPLATETLVPSRFTDHVYTGFVQDEIKLGRRTWLTVGNKLENNNYSGYDLQPSARVLWSPGEHQSLWFGVTRAVTTPSDIEENFFLQGAAGPTTFIQVLGNKQFKSEDVIGYEAGYRVLHKDRFFLDLSGFYNDYSKLQSFSSPVVSVTGGNTYITINYENQIGGSTSGVEFAPQVTLTTWWRVNATYSYVNSDFNAGGPTSNISGTGSVQTYEGSTPKHIVFVQSKIDLPWKIQLDEMYRYASNLEAQKVKAYQTMDLHVGIPMGPHFKLEAVGQNLFQPHHYEWGTGDPTQPPVGIVRAGYVRLAFRSSR